MQGGGASALATNLLGSLAKVVAASGNSALAPGGVFAVSGAGFAATPSPSPSSGWDAPGPAPVPDPTGAAVGGVVAALALLCGGAFVYERGRQVQRRVMDAYIAEQERLARTKLERERVRDAAIAASRAAWPRAPF